jgi:hypothetical protein
MVFLLQGLDSSSPPFFFKKEKVLDIIAFQSSANEKTWRKRRGKTFLKKHVIDHIENKGSSRWA